MIALALTDTSPTPTDTVIAIMGASSVLAGLVLVFLGIAISSVRDALKDVKKIEASWKNLWSNLYKGLMANLWLYVYYLAIPVFALSMASIGISLAWLALPAGRLVYDTDIWLFAAELLAIAALGALVLCVFYLDVKSQLE